MKYLKKIGLAFLFGGSIAVITEVFYNVLAFIPVSPYALSLIVLVLMASIGAMLYVFGLYPKFERIFGFGAMLPIIGLPPAICNGIAQVRKENAPTSQIIKRGFLPIGYVLLFGIGFAVLYAVITTILI